MKYKYEYKIVKPEKDEIIGNKRDIFWDFLEKPSEWKFVALLSPATMLFERVIEEPKTVDGNINSSGTKGIKEI